MAKKDATDLFQVKSEDLKACQKRFDFTVSRDDLKKELDKVTAYFVGGANIPGFRRGKAPRQVVTRKYEKDILDELKMRLFSQAFETLREKEGLDIISWGAPSEKSPLAANPETDYEFSIATEVAPEFELPDYNAMKVEAPKAEITEAMIDERVKSYGEMYGSYAEIDAKAEKEDMLKVSYTSDFEPPEGASPALVRQVSAKENWLWLSEPEMIPGVIAALAGAEKDKDYEFTAEYPADYRDEELAGKKVHYRVHVTAVQRRRPLGPEELAKRMNLANVDKLRETMKSALENETAMKRRNEIAEACMKQLLDAAGNFNLPPNMLNSENEKELRNLARDLVKNDDDVAAFKAGVEQHKEETRRKAEDKLRRLFICRRIAEKEKIAVDGKEVDSQIKGMSKYYGYKEKELRSLLEKNGGIEDLHLDLMVGKVMDFLVQKAGEARQ